MSKEFNKGVIDAKLSELLTESDFTAFNSLNEAEKLNFFINHDLVKTNLVSNFEAMCAYALSDLKAEITDFLGAKHYYIDYFFTPPVSKEVACSTVERFNKTYELAQKNNDEWFTLYLDLKHAVFNLLTILRGTSLGKAKEEIEKYYLTQSFISEEVFNALILGERSGVLNYIKNIFNLDLDVNADNCAIEERLDQYLLAKLKEFAYETDLEPTIIYYIKMKEYEVLRLRSIYYTKEVNL